MKYPELLFVDERGVELQKEDECYHVRQFHGGWQVTTRTAWAGSIGIVVDGHQRSVVLERVQGSGEIARWRLPSAKSIENNHDWRSEVLRETRSATGEITAVLMDDNGKSEVQGSPTAKLRVSPGNVTQSELDQMLHEIGAFAFSSYSCAQARIQKPVSIERDSANNKESIDFHWYSRRCDLVLAQSLLELCDVVVRKIPVILQAPLTVLVREMVPSRIPSSLPSAYESRITRERPAVRSAALPRSRESLDCPENRFISWVLQRFVIPLCRLVERQLLEIEKFQPAEGKMPTLNTAASDQLRVKSRSRTAEITFDANLLRETARTLRVDIQNAQLSMKKIVEAPMFTNVILPKSLPHVTTRLMKTRGYSEIYKAFTIVKGGPDHQLQKLLRLLHLLEMGQIRPTWEVYETWCFTRIYEGLISEFGGSVPLPGESLIDRIVIDNGEIKVLPEPCTLEFTSSHPLHYQNIVFRLWREPRLRSKNNDKNKMQMLRPDILLEVSKNMQKQHFVFDAKYRGYKSSVGRHANFLVKDVRDVAREKYLNSLDSFPDGSQLNIVASFILHSERDDRYDYWGEQPFDDFLEFLNIEKINMNEHVAHRYGAVRFRTANEQAQSTKNSIKKLLHLIAYHSKFESVCLHCGVQAESVDNSAKRTKGRAYSCPSCGDFWLVHNCRGDVHAIHKRRADNIHLPSKNSTSGWMYVCPVCGDTGIDGVIGNLE